MKRVERVVALLRELDRKPKGTRGQWTALCPAHEDANPSLSVSEGDEGRVLVKCHAGCDVTAIVAALGLDMSDLFAPSHDSAVRTSPRPARRVERSAPRADAAVYATADEALAALERRARRRHTEHWRYCDRGGDVVGIAVRFDMPDGKKTFRPIARVPNGWSITAPTAPRPLYQLAEIAGGDGTVHVAEGEKCATALKSLGYAATTSFGGSSAAKEADWSPLASRRVLLFVDNDEPGAKYARDVGGCLMALRPAPELRLVEFTDLSEGGDVADYVLERRAAGCSDDEIRELIESRVRNATSWEEWRDENGDPEKLTKPKRRKLTTQSFADIAPMTLAWLWRDRIPLGKLTLLIGDPGGGKSMLTVDVAARVSAGRPFCDGSPCEIGDVLMLSAEDAADDTIRPRLDAAGADVSRVHHVQMQDAWFSLAVDLPLLERRIKAIRSVRLVVIDPVSSYLDSVDSHNNAAVRSVLGPLVELAQRTGVAVLCVTHMNKDASGKAAYRATGSIAFPATARATWYVVKDPEDEARRLLLPGKCNLGPNGGGLAFRVQGAPDGSAFVAWESGAITDALDDVLARERRDPAQASALEQAEQFLLTELAGGARKQVDIKAAAGRAGVSAASVRRAGDRLGVKSRKVGFTGGWCMYLPGNEGLASDQPVVAESPAVVFLRHELAERARTVDELRRRARSASLKWKDIEQAAVELDVARIPIDGAWAWVLAVDAPEGAHDEGAQPLPLPLSTFVQNAQDGGSPPLSGSPIEGAHGGGLSTFGSDAPGAEAGEPDDDDPEGLEDAQDGCVGTFDPRPQEQGSTPSPDPADRRRSTGEVGDERLRGEHLREDASQLADDGEEEAEWMA